jgi:hypothetical protein
MKQHLNKGIARTLYTLYVQHSTFSYVSVDCRQYNQDTSEILGYKRCSLPLAVYDNKLNYLTISSPMFSVKAKKTAGGVCL